jgi:hypothetical protein
MERASISGTAQFPHAPRDRGSHSPRVSKVLVFGRQVAAEPCIRWADARHSAHDRPCTRIRQTLQAVGWRCRPKQEVMYDDASRHYPQNLGPAGGRRRPAGQGDARKARPVHGERRKSATKGIDITARCRRSTSVSLCSGMSKMGRAYV